jgi:hypothetical protein
MAPVTATSDCSNDCTALMTCNVESELVSCRVYSAATAVEGHQPANKRQEAAGASIVTCSIVTGARGRSLASVGVEAMASTTSWPSVTRPKMV